MILSLPIKTVIPEKLSMIDVHFEKDIFPRKYLR
jgi:hypothetical protein